MTPNCKHGPRKLLWSRSCPDSALYKGSGKKLVGNYLFWSVDNGKQFPGKQKWA